DGRLRGLLRGLAEGGSHRGHLADGLEAVERPPATRHMDDPLAAAHLRIPAREERQPALLHARGPLLALEHALRARLGPLEAHLPQGLPQDGPVDPHLRPARPPRVTLTTA